MKPETPLQLPLLPHLQPSPFQWKGLAAALLMGLLTVAFFWRTISGDVYQPADGGDLVSFLYPTYRFAAAALTNGHLPLWNPTLYGGAPFIADIQAGFLYPPNLVLFLLKPDFDYVWMQWLSIGHLWWAGLGVYVLARALGISRRAAFLAGVAFAFSDPLLIHLGNLNLVAVLSWLGWILAAFHMAMIRRSVAWAGLAGLLFAIANYAGHAQSSYYIGLAVGGYWALGVGYWAGDWRLETKNWSIRSGKGSGRGMADLFKSILSTIQYPFVTFVLTLLLTAPILLPALELIPLTDRADLAYQENVGYSLAPVPALVGLITPGFFGRGPALHWSFWDRVELPYVGAVALLLVLAAFFLPLDDKHSRLLPWIGLAVFALLVSLGVYAPVHGWLTQLLPGFDFFRAPARAIVLGTFSLAVLAGYGVDGLRSGGWWIGGDGENRPRIPHSTRAYSAFLKWGGLLLLVVATPAMYAALLFLQPDSVWFLRASLAGLALSLATGAWLGTWALVSLYRRGHLTDYFLALLLTALLLIELAATGAYTDISESDPARGFDHPEIVAFLREESDRAQPAADGEGIGSPSVVVGLPSSYRIDARTGIDDLWQPDTAALAGLRDVWGIVNPLLLTHWNWLWESSGGRQTRLYDMLNVGHVIVRDGTPLPEKFVLAFDAPGDLAVYRNPDALPQAWLVNDAITMPNVYAALAEILQPDFDPAVSVVLAADGAGSVSNPPILQSPDPPTSQSPNSLHFSLTAPTSGWLVMSEVWYPGWQATVNGVATPVLRANYALRAVAVPAGDVTVVLHFAPESWRWGLWMAGVGGALLLVIWSLAAWRAFLSRRKSTV